MDVPGAGSDGSVLRREMEEERAKSSRLERQVEFLEGALDHERQRNERIEAVSSEFPTVLNYRLAHRVNTYGSRKRPLLVMFGGRYLPHSGTLLAVDMLCVLEYPSLDSTRNSRRTLAADASVHCRK